MEVFSIWLEECPCKISKGHGSSVSKSWFCHNFYFDDIIAFSLTLRYHMRHLQEVFRRLKEHNFKFHQSKCQFFHTQVKYLGHMIYLGGLGVQKAKVEAISKVPQPIDVNWL